MYRKPPLLSPSGLVPTVASLVGPRVESNRIPRKGRAGPWEKARGLWTAL